MKKVALIGKIHPIGLDILKKYEFEIIDLTGFTREELKKNLSNIDAIALRTEILDEDIMKSCQSLKIVSRHGVGFDNVDIKYLKKKKYCSWNKRYIKCDYCEWTCNYNVFISMQKY